MKIPVRLSSISIVTLLFVVAVIADQPVSAQTFSVLYNFTGGVDGGAPKAGLTMDNAGNLYGTTFQGGDSNCNFGLGCGTVFQLKHANSGWVLYKLQTFNITNGAMPVGRVIFGPDGALYGTAEGGGAIDLGVVFRLTPPPNPCRTASCLWTETILHSFGAGTDGVEPTSEVVFDHAGNIFGTTSFGGLDPCGCGTVYELTRSGSTWTENMLYSFIGGADGQIAYSRVVFDPAGNLYGTTESGGGVFDPGTVYKLTPSGGAWQESVIHYFGGPDGVTPYAGVVLDQAGNLYGGTSMASVYELSHGNWDLTVLYTFPFHNGEGNGPWADLSMDSAGNLYGTAMNGSSGCGEVFELSPQGSGWTETILHQFQRTDGCAPMSSVLIDASGNLYGTTSMGGPTHGGGVIWEITR